MKAPSVKPVRCAIYIGSMERLFVAGLCGLAYGLKREVGIVLVLPKQLAQ
jgi:hypothetical protein